MQWWNNLVDWLTSDDGWRVLTTAVFPFLAILVAGVIAALIGRASTRRVLTFQDRELKASAVSALIGVGRKAASWNTLSTQEQLHYDNLIGEADARVRLLPVQGASVAADWAAHQLAEMKKNSAIFSFQAEQTLDEFRDRLVEWQHKPARARKQFKFDLEQWKYSQPTAEQELSVQQQEWAASNRAAQVAAAALPERAAASPAAPAAASSTGPTIASLAEPAGVSSETHSRNEQPEPAAEREGFATSRPEPAPQPTVYPVAQPAAPLAPASSVLGNSAPGHSAPGNPAPATPTTPASPAEPSAFAPASATSTEGYSSPVTANTVRQRINPPTDD